MNNKIFYDFIEKINLIFDFFYNINTTNCFINYKIILGKIDINDIKFSIPNLLISKKNKNKNKNKDDDNDDNYEDIDQNENKDKKKNENEDENEDEINYNNHKINILEGKYKFLSFDENTNEFIFKCYCKNSSYPVFIKINFYKKNNLINSFNNDINNDNLFSYILSGLVLTKKTKHILLPIINIDIKFSEFEKIIKNDIFIYQKIKIGLNNNSIIDTCCFQVRENYFKTVNLLDYIKENYCDIQVLLFQIIHTLAVIDNEYKDFKHNNLLMNNILLYLKRDTTSYSIYEGFKQDNFYISNKGFDIKIYNFNYSIIPKYYEQSFIKKNNNILYDIQTFVNDLVKNIDINKLCDKETKQFIDKILLNKNKKLYITDLLYDEYFSKFKTVITDKNNIKETLYNHLYLTGNFNTTINFDNSLVLGNQKLLNKNKNTRFIKNDNVFIENKLNRVNKYIKSEFEDLYKSNIQYGSGKIIDTMVPPFKKEQNTPFISNDERETFNKKKKEHVPHELPVLLEQKIYDTAAKPPRPQPPPAYIPVNTPYVPLYDKYGNIEDVLPYTHQVNQTPVQNIYNLSFANPLNHTSISKIYEDILPSAPENMSALTVYERNELINYLRNNMINKTDGEEMTNSSTLLSYIKFLDLNPYSFNKNPYYDLPNNFLLYKAAYPVRYDERSKNITIGKDAMAINVRIYMLSVGDLSCTNICMDISHDDFDVWREIKYYNWVRDKIIKNKISPNFIAPILYKIDAQSKINWKEVQLAKKGNIHNGISNKLNDNTLIINKTYPLKKKYGLFDYLLNSKTKQIPHMNNVIDENEDLTIYSGKTLILLTEAPTTCIYKWSSKLYNQFGSVRKMIATGYHSPDVWKAILFQLVYACAILQKSHIFINKLSLNNNIYIKDISYNPVSIGSWIYKINNINYYIPNYGYILLIDSKYTDIDVEDNLLNKNPTDKQKYKIYGAIYEKNFDFDITNIELKIKDQFKDLINPDNFTHYIRVNGGTIPDDSIRILLRNMYNDTETNIVNYLLTYFSNFIHNKIGLPLNKTEFDLLNILSGSNNIIEGAVVPYMKRHGYYEWVLFKNKDPHNNRNIIIITKDDNKYIEKKVSIASLKRYPDIIQQDNKKNLKYDENYIYETYDFSKI
jgi:hypothetical protein